MTLFSDRSHSCQKVKHFIKLFYHFVTASFQFFFPGTTANQRRGVTRYKYWQRSTITWFRYNALRYGRSYWET